MDYRTELLRMIDKFNVRAVEEFKEAEMKIVVDSKFRSITKKKDYGGHIEKLKNVKKRAQKIDPKTIKIPETDKKTLELRNIFEKCLVIFSGVCDSYIQMETALKDKSEGVKISYGSYKEINDKVKFARTNFNENMHELDIIYSDLVEYLEDDADVDYGGIEYRTYDSFR